MDAINMSHILADAVDEIGHGVRLASQDDVPSKTLVCFLDWRGAFHFGFGYKNGSNLRVVCWENNEMITLKTTPKGAFIIAFDDEVTQKRINSTVTTDFDAEDFNFQDENNIQWFDDNAKQKVKQELEALNNKQDKVAGVIEGLAGLTIHQIDEVVGKIDELKGNN